MYFAGDQNAGRFAATSDTYTAWKHLHIEREQMCNVGGILFRDYGAPGLCGGANQPACCGTPSEPACNQIVVYEETPAVFAVGQELVVFDKPNPYETAGYTAQIITPAPASNGDGSITITLDTTNTTIFPNQALPRSYRASTEHLPGMLPHVPDFKNGYSGGVCVPSGGFVEADLSDLRQAYDHALVDYHVPIYGLDGSGVVPRLWPKFFDFHPVTGRTCASSRFSEIWFSRFVDVGTITNCPDPPANPADENNTIHVIAAFDTDDADNPAGLSIFAGGFTYLFDDQIAQDCAATSGGCGTKLDTMRRWTAAHEKGHHFRVNKCSPGGHDTPRRDAWCGGAGGTCVVLPALAQDCLMVTSSPPTPSELDMRADGTDHFCKEDLALGDPNPSCGGTPREGAIRTVEDPQ